MEMNDNIKECMTTESTTKLRIAKAIASVKRTSERVIGITNIEYPFSRLTFYGTTVRPEPITPLERAVVGIIDIDGDTSLEKVGMILGLDIMHDNAEKDMLLEAINKMKDYGILEGDESYLCLTEKGRVFAKEGERPVTYSKDFNILYDEKHPKYVYLGVDFPSSKLITKEDSISQETTLNNIDTIRAFAEVQAQNVQNEKNRYILQAATLKNTETIITNFFVVILQSIKDENEYRFFAYDDTQELILPHLSELIQSEREWNSFLLEQCINNSLTISEEDGGWIIVPSDQEKNEEQIAIEAELVQYEEDEAKGKEIEGNDLERLHKKAIYDQVSFELELNKIFIQDNPDEVWLISPFVSWSFVKVRVKQIEPLLKANKRVFIAYSEPYNNRPTISPEAQQAVIKEINRLSKTYPNFYYVELPMFHTKQVLEVKNGQCVLFNGSFNVLSFDNVSIGRKVSREEMALVHHQVAISKHQEYIETFASIYEKRILAEINQSSNPNDVASIKSDRIDYLREISNNKDRFVDFYTEYDEKTLQAKNSAWYEECDKLIENIKQTITVGAVDSNDFKTMCASYQRLIKTCVALTISPEKVRDLENSYADLETIPKTKKTESFFEQAMAVIESANFENEKKVTLYVSALQYLYANRAFNQVSVGARYLKKLLQNSKATSYLSVFEFVANKNGKMFDVIIGVGGYLFRLPGILPLNMEIKLKRLRIPKGSTRLKNVNLRDLEEIVKKLIIE